MERAIPHLPGTDLRMAKTFYVDALGFQVRFEATDDGITGILGLERGSLCLTIDAPMPGHGRDVCVSLEVDDVDRYYAEWSARVHVLRAPKDEEWGARTFDLLDPFGNTLFVMGPLASIREDPTAGRLREALEGYERAADLARRANDMGQLAHAQRHVSDLQRELGQYRSAESAAAEAVTLLRRHGGGASLDLANALRLLALAQESLEQWPEAEGSWREARELYMAVGVLEGVHECDEHIGRRGRV